MYGDIAPSGSPNAKPGPGQDGQARFGKPKIVDNFRVPKKSFGLFARRSSGCF
jgi:hypothetical protein